MPPDDEFEPFAPPAVPGYEVVELLGRGGMGVVYRARHTPTGRSVALKVARAGADAEDLARFRAEAEAAAGLRHPNVVEVHEVGTAGGRPYLAFEFVPGGSLDRVIDGAPQPPRTAAATVERLGWAVHAAHLAGILHRDLKPANVLLAAAPPGGELAWEPKVADFGLARRLHDDSGHGTGAIFGTPSYMAPEQARPRAAVGPAADVWALGAILYHMLTGRPPFRAASAWDTLTQVRHADPIRPAAVNPAVPAGLELICLKCLRKSPRRRYASAAALADDLRRFLDGELALARPPGPAERFGAWAGRRSVGAVWAIVLLAAVGVAAAVYFW